ncbi:MAG TPA: hypothetical protein PKC62_01600 [Ferruginibacter sp.]|nr:hypothetical protein [Bacteroidota bacterium]MBS1926293.1 hypothetical protein [Bacteroidota bacterium]MCC6693159.1 hypothetical protein [Chitinophagaceae bacterium]HMT95356.1 hypothetical protein [Ferruginibacter sp.]HMU25114.1 hypothetical protein [Ferruginibacter sp.]
MKMFKKAPKFIAFVLCFTSTHAFAQFYNNGATVKIQPGGLIFVQGNAENNTGTITNDGKMEVQGNFINAATYNTVTNDDSLILTGSNNVTLTLGSSSVNNLMVNKAVNTNNVTLGSNINVITKLDYLAGNLTTDPLNTSYVFSAPIGALFNFAAGREITGRVSRTGWADGTAYVFNQPNMQVTTNGGTAPTSFTVNMIPQSGGGDPSLNEREVKRKFEFSTPDGSGFTSDIRFAYDDAELNTNTEPSLAPWYFDGGTEWNGKLASLTKDGSNNYVQYTGITGTELAEEWKLADAKYTINASAIIRGPWNSGASQMNTTLNTNNVIPLNQPYNVTPFNYTGTESVASIPNANVVDWILVELRKPSSGLPEDANSASIIGRKAGFLLNDGTIVDIDGVTPIAFDISKQGPSFIAIRHRNHLGILSNIIPSNITGNFDNDFTALANCYKNPFANSDPLVLLGGASGKYGMWAGDANKNNLVNGTDLSIVNNGIAGSASGYINSDINLSSSLNGTDLSITNNTLSQSGESSQGRHIQPNFDLNTKKFIKSNLPE